MTAVGEPSLVRTAIHASCSSTIVADNQIYARGTCDPNLTGIRVSEPAVDLAVHGNLLRNCGTGIAAASGWATVGELVDSVTFVLGRGRVAPERRQSHGYRGWTMAWTRGGKPAGLSVVESFDPETLQFKLREPREIRVGDRFELIAPSFGWNIHDNTITGCLHPALLDAYGSPTSAFKNNLLTRGGTTGVKAAIEFRGQFQFLGNQLNGFDERDACAWWPIADPLGRAALSVYRGNTVQACTQVTSPTYKGPAFPADTNTVVK
jgi:hypothetical protein